jgi:adenylosuccinate synthase
MLLIGAGVVINPERLATEIDELSSLGVDVGPSRLKIGAAAQVILPTHRALDGAREASRGKDAIGTTKRGIGPTYADKAARVNVRAGEMTDPARFARRVAQRIESHNRRLQAYGLEPLSAEDAAASYKAYAERLSPHLVDASSLIGEALEAGKTVLCEGAQGLLLDLDHGTYPYVTSSSTIAGGATTGLGFGPKYVSCVVGVAKAYTTRVGEGPFPTELLGEVGDRIREAGNEFGTTTGRPRRCGWLDLPILRYAARVNGLDELALTKLDVLSGLEELKVAVAYQRGNERVEHFPAEFGVEALAEWTPVYEGLPGWDEDITAARRRDDLPQEAQTYVSRVEAWVGVPITFIGVGPEREQAIR